MKLLLAGNPDRTSVFRERFLNTNPTLEIEISDGDSDEDFEDYDVIFDLNFDDDNSNLSIYAAMKDKFVFVSAAKQSLAEAVYQHDVKVKCKLFGINAIPAFANDGAWEVSLYRKFENDDLQKLGNELGVAFLSIEDRVGLVKPRVIFMIINEACYTLQEGTATIEDIDKSMKLGTNYPFGPFEWCDKIGITNVFETLVAIYEDTKDERYRICPLLKHKYLRNETFYREKKIKEQTSKIKEEEW
ncbi:MAG TPA: 3-hydroxyacyl-CoA dehydrogenase family protein [Chitinophagales bacterium]